MTNSKVVIIDHHPGRSAQTIGIARELGTDPDLIHEPSVGVVGTKGDSQCYMGVAAKVEAIHASLKSRIGKGAGQLKLRLVQPEYTIATSDGIRNGTREMRYSLIGREMTHDALCEHLSATGLAGTIAVVACDKPPVGTLAALLEHNQPAIIMSDGRDPSRHRPENRRETRHRQRLSGRRQSRRRVSPPHRLPCLPRLRQLRRHVHLQHHADLHRRRRHAAAAHGGPAVRRSAPPQGIPGPAGRVPRADDRKGPEAARHRGARFDPQRRHRRDGDRRLDQCHAACAGDRARRRLRGLLERGHDAGRVQPSVAVRRAGPHRRPPLRQIFDGRHRRGRRRAGDRARTAGGRTAQRRRDDLHRRNAGPAGQAPRHQEPPTAR